MFHDVSANGSALPEGTLVEYRTVTQDADGDRAAASSYASVGVDVSGVVDDGTDPEIDMVTVAGSHNSEMGCAGDWTPDCEAARLTLADDGTYTGTFELPAGSYEFKVALNGSWAENYGADGVRDGANVPYSTGGGPVTFTWDPETKVPTVQVGTPGTPGEGQQAAHWVREDLVLVPGRGLRRRRRAGRWRPARRRRRRRTPWSRATCPRTWPRTSPTWRTTSPWRSRAWTGPRRRRPCAGRCG